MKTWPLVNDACVLLSPVATLLCTIPAPESTPFTAILPNPASNIAGGSPESGPAMEGAPSGAGAAGAAAASAGLASAGGVCALQTEATARQSTNTPRHTI